MPSRRRMTAYMRRSRASRQLSFNAARTINTLAVRAIRRNSEKKFSIIQGLNTQLNHNAAGYCLNNNLLEIGMGLNQNQRSGDKIRSLNLQFRVWLSNKLDRPNVMYRVTVVKGDMYDMLTTNPLTTFFLPTSGASGSQIMIDHINYDKYSVLYDRTFQPPAGDYSLEASVPSNSTTYDFPMLVDGGFVIRDAIALAEYLSRQATYKERSKLVTFNIPTNKIITYRQDQGVIPEGKNVYAILVHVYDAFGTLVSDQIATVSWTMKHNFIDI